MSSESLAPDQLLAQRELEELRGWPIVRFELGARTTISLLSALQLAMRHPEFPTATRESVLPFALELQRSLSRFPGLAMLGAAGWDTLDVPAFNTGEEADAPERAGWIRCERCSNPFPEAIASGPCRIEEKQRATKVIHFDSGPIVIERDGMPAHYCRGCARELVYCHICGCTHEVPCEDAQSGATCSWVPSQKPLCSACVKTRRARRRRAR